MSSYNCFSKRAMLFSCLLGAFFLLSSYGSNIRSLANKNSSDERLIIGVITQPIPKTKNKSEPIGYIDATYVDLLESYNVSVVPIYHGLTHKAIRVLLNRIDGLLLTGGTTTLMKYNRTIPDDDSETEGGDAPEGDYKTAIGFSKFGRFLQNLIYQASDLNKLNGTFPVYAICLSNEMLGLSYADSLSLLRNFTRWKKKDRLAPIKFIANKSSSKIMSGLSDSLISKMENSPSQLFHHHYSLSYEVASKDSSFSKEFEIVATAKDIYDNEYVAIMESKTRPFIGTQFHTNKIQSGSGTDDTQEKIQDYFMKYLINLAKKRKRSRKSDQQFIEKLGIKSSQKKRIPTYTGGDVYLIDFSKK